MSSHPTSDPLWKLIYPWLIVATAAAVTARIAGSERVYEASLYAAPEDKPGAYQSSAHGAPGRTWPKERPEPTPMFGSNDRSRWATIHALVENGTYVVGRRHDVLGTEKGYHDDGVIFQPQYGSVDKVLHPETHEFYSSKPPLYATILAGEYWLIKNLTGWSLDQNRWEVVTVILFTVNVLPLVLLLVLLAKLADQYSTDVWAKLFVMVTACFGTYLTTFSVTLNNHTPAACLIMVALYLVLRSPSVGENSGMGRGGYALAGFCASLAACLDLPAASFCAGIALVLLLRDAQRTLLAFVPAALIPVAGFFGTNYLALGELTPAYEKFGTEWYEYPGSHWYDPEGKKEGIDFANDPMSVYALHFLVGHHGVFSLTPVWLAAVAGMIAIALRGRARAEQTSPMAAQGLPSWLGWGTALLTVVVAAFYISRTNNFGGWSSGPRWMFWLIPLWLVCLLPAGEWLARSRIRRVVAYGLLALSVFSASYPAWNPWRHPWIYQMFEYYGWVRY